MTDWIFERPPELPLPQPAEESSPFWAGVREHRLLLQQCASCDRLGHPPRARCPACGAMQFSWREAAGTGSVYSYVVTHQAVHPALAGFTPFATVEVELDEGVRMASNLIDTAPEGIEIGTRVRVEYVEVAEGVTLPLFRRDT